MPSFQGWHELLIHIKSTKKIHNWLRLFTSIHFISPFYVQARTLHSRSSCLFTINFNYYHQTSLSYSDVKNVNLKTNRMFRIINSWPRDEATKTMAGAYVIDIKSHRMSDVRFSTKMYKKSKRSWFLDKTWNYNWWDTTNVKNLHFTIIRRKLGFKLLKNLIYHITCTRRTTSLAFIETWRSIGTYG